MNYSLIRLRKKKKISRKELSELVEISESMIEKVERGTRRASPDLARNWGRVLGLEESQLYQYFFTEKPDIMCRNGGAIKDSKLA